ncbi:MAG: saccharopine dehydrogenase NADP-binding domain-containing protein [Pseudonocardiales bacterium]|nr:saccharopine dehydrogenase NADP-binding domain-containing protein [Pseudonocardiales bacterium]
MIQRDIDVVVFGATSITGRHVAAYLAQRASERPELHWAVAARDGSKAERVLAEEGVKPPETIVADVGNPSSLAAMASRAIVVLNLVGPYTLYGEPVIEACVDAGSHYADLTGEIPFVRRMNTAFDARARAGGIKIVQVCGFEALPPDLGVALAAEAAAEAGEQLLEVDLETRIVLQPTLPRPSDVLSGGTLQSIAAVAGDPEVACILDPGCLVADPGAAQAVRLRSPIRVRPRRRDSTVIAPMSPAAFINPAVIHRSAALRAEEHGEPFTPFAYSEGLAIGGSTASLPVRYAVAGTLSGIQGVMGLLAHATRPDVGRAVSRFVARTLPTSGYGPARDRLERWRWEMSIQARTATSRELRVEISADGHPGYLTTPRMLGEVGLLLSEAGSTPDRFGCLTPSTALGTSSAGRFARAGLRFSLPSAATPLHRTFHDSP